MIEKDVQRHALTGFLTVEWVDGADPDDASLPPSFGWSSFKTEPKLYRRRLLVLLHELAATVQEDIDLGVPD
jgi:hypothetical protein